MLEKCIQLFFGAFFLGLGTLMFLKPERYSKGNNEAKKIKNIKIRGIITCICGVLILILAFSFMYLDK